MFDTVKVTYVGHLCFNLHSVMSIAPDDYKSMKCKEMKKLIKIIYSRSIKHSFYVNDLTITLFGRYMILLMWDRNVIPVLTPVDSKYFFEVVDCKDGKCRTIIKLPKS